jgi:hypothetical protein
VRIIGAAEADGLAVAHVDMHGFLANRAGRPLAGVQPAKVLQYELPATDLAQVSFLIV